MKRRKKKERKKKKKKKIYIKDRYTDRAKEKMGEYKKNKHFQRVNR